MMRSLLTVIFFLSYSVVLLAQQPVNDTSQRFVVLNEVVVSGTKFQEKKKNIAQKIDVLSSKYIAKINAQG
jgi:hemoglobin/transferrin/lactoferrin receptor protein